MSDTERIDRIENLLNQLITAVGVPLETHSPALSGNTVGECPAKPDSKSLVAACPPAPNDVCGEFSPTTSSSTPTITPEPIQEKSIRISTAETDATTHPLEKSFWESIHCLCLQASREEVHKILSDALRELRRQSVLTK